MFTCAGGKAAAPGGHPPGVSRILPPEKESKRGMGPCGKNTAYSDPSEDVLDLSDKAGRHPKRLMATACTWKGEEF